MDADLQVVFLFLAMSGFSGLMIFLPVRLATKEERWGPLLWAFIAMTWIGMICFELNS